MINKKIIILEYYSEEARFKYVINIIFKSIVDQVCFEFYS